MSSTAQLGTHRIRPPDLARLAVVGIRTRRLRAALSALGIAIGVAAIVAVLGLSASSQAGLLAQIDQLGTNLLTVANGQTLGGQTAELPVAAPGMLARIGPVTDVQFTGTVEGVNAFRSRLIPTDQHQRVVRPSHQPGTALHHLRPDGRGSFPQRGHRAGAGRRARRRGRVPDGHRPDLPG